MISSKKDQLPFYSVSGNNISEYFSSASSASRSTAADKEQFQTSDSR